MLEADLRDALDPLLQLFHLDHALALHVGQELGELPVRGLLHVERPIGLGYHVDSEEVAAQHGQLHFLCRRFPRLRQDSDLITILSIWINNPSPRFLFGNMMRQIAILVSKYETFLKKCSFQ